VTALKAADFFTLPPSLAVFATHFPADALPWEWLRRIGPALEAFAFQAPLPPLPPGVHAEGPLWIHPTVKLPHYATLIGPAYIGANTEIRPGAWVRGNVMVGEGCVLGHACEYKNCLLMDGVATPHYNYVGDSILGNGAHLGAGAICSNYRLDHRDVLVREGDTLHATGLRKFGAILGDGAEVGCNAVLNPGTLLGKRALVMPAIAFGGYLPAGHLGRVRYTATNEARRD
jgi:UDP-N-acetylglucosamine diphosphorylase / glucose-1-phosphate thymidylyltransferase / UDP-N-acetylgalactosamine diphosphorylase / glucosamine-1-phosphate N-acetyltransferase / galactosamine-1-phosphate N-acetyltransferase